MQRVMKVIAVCVMMLSVLSFVPQQADASEKLKEGETFHLTVLHSNDWHGHLDDTTKLENGKMHENNVAKYATKIKEVKQQEDNVLVLDGGDLFLRGEFESAEGDLETKLMKKMGYDGLVIGNNDFRVHPAGTGDPAQRDAFLKNYQKNANFPLLLGNVIDKDTNDYMKMTDLYHTYTFKKGVKIGVIGLTSMKPENRKWNDVKDLDFIEPTKALKKLVPEVSKKSDANIVLSHVGNKGDHDLAKHPGVSAVLGADTHKVIKGGAEYESNGHENVPITQGGGEEEHYLGRLNLTYKVKNGQLELVDSKDKLYDIENVKADPKIKHMIDEYRADMKDDQGQAA
ncbi:bifunctional metallophosphatase/5'-nucleotidase [Staphylococcus massiliensis]|uniref:bifunctional metallophosphatase/5'-nucleotidase n=1 Tax=Staphylococcus massiliensis TaxID=555791 RepID=UPI001EDD128A|nr:metallophosphoesterase [Staphylococcus massiliensis]MCG3398927.1 metallophosphoesterase [Staphylococcus massiliensis]